MNVWPVAAVSVSQVRQDTAVAISPVSSPSQSMSPRRSVLMEVMMAAQHKRTQDSSDNMVMPTSPTSQSFQDQLKSKLEARKRSVEVGDTHDIHQTSPAVSPVSIKGAILCRPARAR